MKRILILNHNQERFGTYFRCFFIAEGLSKRKYKVTMLCASGKKFDLSIKKQKVNKNFTIITLPRIKYHEYFTGQALLRLPITCLYVLLAKYDLLYAFTVAQPQIGIPAWLAKAVRKKPLIIDWDDLWGGGFATVHRGVVEKVLTWCERNLIKAADKVTYVSEYLGREIDKIDPLIDKTRIGNGANVRQIPKMDKNQARKKLGYGKDETLAVSIGNTYTDSFGLMLKAFGQARKKIKNLKLLLVGNVIIKDKFKELLENLGESVVIVGSKPYSEIPIFMAVADVLVLPMDDDPIEWARFPMRFGDYLCAERPIVSNAVGEVKYYLEKCQAGLTSDPHRAGEFGENILRVLEDRKRGRKLSLNARNLAEGDLSWRVMVKKADRLISSFFEVL